MLEVYCSSHRSKVLLPAGRIERLKATADGLVVHWKCWCGQTGRWHANRKLSAPTPEVSVAC
jgi:hypothetical protein